MFEDDRPLLVPARCVRCGHVWQVAGEAARCPSCRSRLCGRADTFDHRCVRCGHEWSGRTESPVRCPSCRSRSWRSESQGADRAPEAARESWPRQVTDAVILRLSRKGHAPAQIAMSIGVSVSRVMAAMSAAEGTGCQEP